MNTFKRKALSCAVLAGLGVASSAEAVVLNPSNTGQVLIFPYYTVNAAGGNAFMDKEYPLLDRIKRVTVTTVSSRTSKLP